MVRGQRPRRAPVRRLPATARGTITAQIAELRRMGLRLMQQAEQRAIVQTRNNGAQINPLFREGRQLIEQADRCENRWFRRADGERADPSPGREPKDELDAFRKQKTKTTR